jgi:hypothetical protein
MWWPRYGPMELLNINRNERKRLTILSQVKQGALSLIVAAGLLGLGYRQAKRVWQRYRTQGAAGLLHRSRGRPITQALAHVAGAGAAPLHGAVSGLWPHAGGH